MRGFTRALGVRCSYCHVGEEDQPLTTYDFASDANPKKEVARQMLDLLRAVNERLVALGVADDERVNMWCHTCHRGVAKPRTLAEQLRFVYERDGVAAVAEEYRQLEERYRDAGAFEFSRPALVDLAGRLVEGEQVGEALALLRLDLERHPEAAEVHLGLSEAYEGEGRRELASIHARRALELEPDHPRLPKVVRRLESPAVEPP